MIVAQAAKGLAKLGNPKAVDELIAAGRRATGDARAGIVQALIYFSDPKAQEAATNLLPDKQKSLLEFFRREKESYGTRILFEW